VGAGGGAQGRERKIGRDSSGVGRFFPRAIEARTHLDEGLRPDDEGHGGEGVDDGDDEERVAEDGDAGVDDGHELRELGGGAAEEVLQGNDEGGLWTALNGGETGGTSIFSSTKAWSRSKPMQMKK
jgi:hypothetical protein